MTNTKQKINIGVSLLFAFLIIPFLGIAGIKNAISPSLYQAWQIISVCFLLILVFLKHAQIKINWALGLYVAYQAVIVLSSTVNNGFSPGIITVIVAAVLIFALLQTDFYYEILSAAVIIVVIMALVNFPSMLQSRDSIDIEFFVGGKNSLGIFFIPGVFMLIINSLEKNGKVSKLCLLGAGLCLLTVFISSSGTGVVVAFCTLFFLLLAIKFRPRKIIYLAIILVIYALFLLFSEDFFLTEYWFRFTDLLGKDSTLTARTSIWSAAEELIKQNWLFGAGRGVELSYINSLGYRHIIYEAHNLLLEILLEGGAAALLLFGALFSKTIWHLDMKNAKHKIVFVALFVILVNGLTESTVNTFFVMILLGIACRCAGENNKEKIRESNG